MKGAMTARYRLAFREQDLSAAGAGLVPAREAGMNPATGRRYQGWTFWTKRMVPEIVDGKVWMDGDNVEVIGVIPVSGCVITTPQMGLCSPNDMERLPLRVRI